LIWTIIGETAAVTAATARTMDDSSRTFIGFPYSLFLSAIGSAITTVVALVNFRALWTDKQPNYNPHTYEAQKIQPPVQAYVPNNAQQQYPV